MTQPADLHPPTHPADLPDGSDLRLVVADMDGTLLDADGVVPDAFWPLLDEMRQRGIVFAPASGRQYATLLDLFRSHADGMSFIAENGTLVMRDGVEVASMPLDRGFVVDAITRLRGMVEHGGRDLGLVLCAKQSAWVERDDPDFLAECGKYYALLQHTDDVLSVDDDVLKIAVYDFGDGEHDTAPLLADMRATHQVVVSGRHWIDLMPKDANKGVAVRALQHALGITAAQTAAFGDYLNDYELMGAAGMAFAMANAHPRVVDAASHVAPANVDEGVVTVLEHLLAHGRTA